MSKKLFRYHNGAHGNNTDFVFVERNAADDIVDLTYFNAEDTLRKQLGITKKECDNAPMSTAVDLT